MTGRRLIALASVIFLLDQATKIIVIDGLGLAERLRIDIIPDVLSFRMGWNTGINFGLFASGSDAARWMLAALAIAVSAIMAVWALRRRERWITLGAGLVIGGALGNAVDRVRWGAVADFLNVTCCGYINPYAFNVADVAIFAGAAAIVFAPSAPAQSDREGGLDGSA
jgi:signal peptidase II